MATPAAPFQMIAGHPALDLVNTLDFRFRPSGPDDLLLSYDDLLRFVTQAGLFSSRRPRTSPATAPGNAGRARVLRQAKELRESLAAIAYAMLEEREPPPADLAVLQKHFHHAAAHRKLAASGKRLLWQWQDSEDVAAPLWRLAQNAADLFLSGQTVHLRSCASDACRWLFLDTSKNHTRRWCDMKICGNRMKARRFQARSAAS